jgi:hypothetical protein
LVKGDLRTIDQPAAPRILHAISRYPAAGEGDVKCLRTSNRPRCG